MIIYPDIEALIVGYLQPLFPAARVATKRAEPGTVAETQIIIVGSYNLELDPVRREASAVIEIMDRDEIAATNVALEVAAAIKNIAGEFIKRVTLSVGPIRVTDETEFEKRSIGVDFIVKGAEFNFPQ